MRYHGLGLWTEDLLKLRMVQKLWDKAIRLSIVISCWQKQLWI